MYNNTHIELHKNNDRIMGELSQRCSGRIKSVILIGQDRELIAAAFKDHSPSTELYRIDQISDAKKLMNDVVIQAIKIALSYHAAF